MLDLLLELLKIPEIAPDEDILGWIHAIADANGWDHDSFFSAFLPDCYIAPENSYHMGPMGERAVYVRPDYYIRNYTKYYGLYSHLGFPSPQDMLMEHTSIPFCGLFMDPEEVGLLAEVVLNGSNAEIGPAHRPFLYKDEKDILVHPPMRYCPYCAGEDLEMYGRVIAHVPHQGWDRGNHLVHVCYRHKARLVKIEKLEPASTVKRPGGHTGRAWAAAETLEYLYRVRAVGDVTDLSAGYRRKFGRDMPEQGPRLDCAVEFTRDELVLIYEKDSILPALNIKASRVMKARCKDAELLGYSPFPLMKYRCGGYRGESISYILSLTSGMTCKLCGKCGKPETVPWHQ